MLFLNRFLFNSILYSSILCFKNVINVSVSKKFRGFHGNLSLAILTDEECFEPAIFSFYRFHGEHNIRTVCTEIKWNISRFGSYLIYCYKGNFKLINQASVTSHWERCHNNNGFINCTK